MSSFLFSSYLLHFNCKFVALKTKKILSTNHHYGNPSTRFSVEPKKLRFPRPLAVFPNVRQKLW